MALLVRTALRAFRHLELTSVVARLSYDRVFFGYIFPTITGFAFSIGAAHGIVRVGAVYLLQRVTSDVLGSRWVTVNRLTAFALRLECSAWEIFHLLNFARLALEEVVFGYEQIVSILMAFFALIGTVGTAVIP
jgi:hypothetical protein